MRQPHFRMPQSSMYSNSPPTRQVVNEWIYYYLDLTPEFSCSLKKSNSQRRIMIPPPPLLLDEVNIYRFQLNYLGVLKITPGKSAVTR